MYRTLAPRPTLIDRVGLALAGIRDWLDERGKPAWIVAMILGFVLAWPVGLGILGYMIWSKRMFGTCHARRRDGAPRNWRSHAGTAATGNTAFDAYRDETLKRLEEEHDEFLSFLARLREARDKAEFDQFMEQRRAPETTTPATTPPAVPAD